MSGSVDDDEIALFRAEKNSCRVDGDPLRLLVLERIDEKSVFKRTRIESAVIFYRFEFSFRKTARFTDKSADYRAFSVVDMPCKNYRKFFTLHILLRYFGEETHLKPKSIAGLSGFAELLNDARVRFSP